MIRVLQIVSAMNRGGLETFIMNIYRNIDRNIVQFDFLVHTDKEGDYDREILELGGNIYSVPSRREGIFENRQALDRFFKSNDKYNVVHQHVSSLSYIEPLKVAKKYGVKTRIVHSHSSKQSGNKLNKYIHYFNQLRIENVATHYFACSDLAAKWLFGTSMYEKNKHCIINNGIELTTFKYNIQTREKYRKELKIDDRFVIGHVGRFAYPKNHDFLIEVFKVIYRKNNNSILLLVGDGELRHKAEKKVEDLGLKNSVIFLGLRSDIPELLQAMDVFVLPSHYEGLPVTLVEAQAAGLICFASDAITKQVNITELINNISLNNSAEFWADRIIETSKDYSRKDITPILKDNDFDIASVIEKLMEYYT